MPARLRVVITDACTSGALIRTRGGKPIQPFVVDLEQGQRIEGDVYITSTGPNEPAQEWEALASGLMQQFAARCRFRPTPPASVKNITAARLFDPSLHRRSPASIAAVQEL